uniref:CSON006853 protein n=1 Tax=Culicoides sonorensis TaxID=179676 RepID=A0A336KM61_CULSO
MANIDSLPPEILIHLFKYLSSEDRKIASEVCHFWHDIWMERIFDDDRTLKFYHCEINETTAPASILMKTERKYTKMVLGEEIEFHDNYSKLFESLEDITKIEFDTDFESEHLNFKTNNFIGLFKKLKELTIPLKPWDIEMNVLENLPQSIEVLTLSLMYDDYSREILNDLRSSISQLPNLKEFNLECWIPTQNIFEFIATSPLTHLTKLSMRIDSHGVEFLKKLEASNLIELFLEFDDHNCLGKLDEIIPNFPKLKVLKLETPGIVPTTIHANLIKYLDVQCTNFYRDNIKPLQYLTELEELYINIDYREQAFESCFFSHETYLNPNLKRFETIELDNEFYCHMCFENLVKSFPNLESLILKMPLEPHHFYMIHKYLTKLKTLDIRHCKTKSKNVPSFKFLTALTNLRLDQYVITDQSLDVWPKMPHLRSLRMTLDDSISLDKFSKMIRNVSGLEELTFNKTNSVNDGVMKVVAENLKRLRKVGGDRKEEVFRITENGASLIPKNCKYIKRDGFPFFELFQKDREQKK